MFYAGLDSWCVTTNTWENEGKFDESKGLIAGKSGRHIDG